MSAKEAADKAAAAKDRILDVAYRDGLRLRTNQLSPFQFREHLGYEVDNLIVEVRAALAPKLEKIRRMVDKLHPITGRRDLAVWSKALAAIDEMMKE